MKEFHSGDTCYILENNRTVRKATIVKRTGDFYLLQFGNSNGMTRLRANRLFHTEQEAYDSRYKNEYRMDKEIHDTHGYVDVFAGRRTNRNPHA